MEGNVGKSSRTLMRMCGPLNAELNLETKIKLAFATREIIIQLTVVSNIFEV